MADTEPSSSGLDEPTILLVAAGERLAPALAERLRKHGLAIELAEPSEVAEVAFAAAPDLVVLAGTAAEDGGLDVLTALSARAATSALPVVLVSEERPSSPRVSSFRHGVVAVVERSASADEMARRIAELAHELPERSGETAGTLRQASVEELVDLFAASLRSGILAVKKEGGPSAQIVLRADQPVEAAIEQLVERLRPLVSEGHGELSYEFHESAPSRISSLDLALEQDASPGHLRGRRILVIEQNAARSDRLGHELRSAGALVVVADGSGHGLELARDLTPEVVVVDGSGVEGWAMDALRQLRRDVWLRWASLLMVESDKLWRDRRRPDVALLAAPIDAQLAPDRELAARAARGRETSARLEAIGPFRTLRALAETRLGLRVTIRHPRLLVEVDLFDGLVAGASAREPHARGRTMEGAAALAALFGLASGRVHVVRADAPRTANVMAPLDDALAAAGREDPVVAPSLPPPSLPAPAAPAPSVMPAEDIKGLVTRLETLLAQIRDATGEAPTATAAPSPATGAEVPRRSELPPIEADDVDTGLYDPGIVQRLRTRMRRSSPRLAAIAGGSNEGAAEAAPTPAASVARPPAGIAKPARPAGGGDAKPSAPRVPRPAVPPPGAPLPPAVPGPKPRARRLAGKHPTLVLGSVSDAPESAEGPTSAPTRLEASAPTTVPSATADARAEPAPAAVVAPAEETRPGDLAASSAAPAAPADERPHPALAPSSAPAQAPARPVPPPPPAPVAIEPDASDAGTTSIEPAPIEPAGEPSLAPGEGERASERDPRLAPPTLTTSKRRGGGLGLRIALVGVPVLLALVVGVAWRLVRGRDAPSSPDPVEIARPDPPPRDGPTALDPVETARPEPPPRDAPTPPPRDEPAPAAAAQGGGSEERPALAMVGPGPSDPIEGRVEDFDLEQLGITSAARPNSRRVVAQAITTRLRQANAARNRGEIDAAERDYRAVLALEPDNPRAAAGLARVAMDRSDPARAVLFAQRLVRLRPAYASNYVLLGDTLLLAQNRDAARRAFEHAVSIDPSWPPPRERLAALDASPP